MDNLKGCGLHCECRRLEDTLIQMFEGGSSFRILHNRLFLCFLLHDHAGNLNQHIREREQQRGHRQVEDRMENGNLHRVDIGHRKRRTQAEKDETNGSEYNRANDVEGQVHDSCTFCRAGAAHTGKHGSHAGTDILAQRNVDGCVGGYDAVHGQGLQDTNGSRRTLQQRGNQRTNDHAQKRVAAQHLKGLRKNRSIRIGIDGAGHKVQTNKQQAKTNHDLADRLFLLTLCKHQKQGSDTNDSRSIKAWLHDRERVSQLAHGYDPCCDGGTNVGTHDHADCLGQVQHACTYKTDYHNRCRATGLDDRRDQCAQCHSQKPVIGEHSKKAAHLASRRLLHTICHDVHAIKEHTKTTKETKPV